MKITVIIPSRKRVLGLLTMLKSLRMLQSGKHEVCYVVGCDADDKDTVEFCKAFQYEMPFYCYVGAERPESLGGFVNEIANLVPGDVYTSLSDDAICIQPYWDKVIAEAVEKTPHGVFWWKDRQVADAAYAIVTEKWRQAAGGIFTTHFPYWFDDLYLAELWVFATLTAPIVLDLNLADFPQKTMRMRELSFWVDFFWRTRKQRLVEGKAIGEKLQLPIFEEVKKLDCDFDTAAGKIVNEINTTWIRMPEERMAEIENSQGECDTPPDANYVRAKQRAEETLRRLAA